MVAADPRVVPVSADPISSRSAIARQPARPGCMHTAPRRNKISRSLSGCIFSFYTDRRWTNMSAFQKSTEGSTLLKCIAGGGICKPACAWTGKTREGWLRDGTAIPAGFYLGVGGLCFFFCFSSLDYVKKNAKPPVLFDFYRVPLQPLLLKTGRTERALRPEINRT